MRLSQRPVLVPSLGLGSHGPALLQAKGAVDHVWCLHCLWSPLRDLALCSFGCHPDPLSPDSAIGVFRPRPDAELRLEPCGWGVHWAERVPCGGHAQYQSTSLQPVPTHRPPPCFGSWHRIRCLETSV